MKRTLTQWIALALLVAAPLRAENECPWFDASCKVMAYADLKQLREVPAVVDLLAGQNPVTNMIQAIREWTGVDLDTASSLWLAVAGKDDVIVLLEGAFNLTTIRGRVGAIEAFRVSTPEGTEFAVTMPDEKNPGKVNMAAFLSPTLLAMGQPERVEGYLANRAAGTKHPRYGDFSTLERSAHLIEAVVLEIPNDGKTPALLIDNIALARFSVDAAEDVELSLAVEPANAKMVTPLCSLAQSLLDLYHLVPTRPARLGAFGQALIDQAQISGSPRTVRVSTTIPAEMIRKRLAAKLGTGQRQNPKPAP
ncbi:MAG: hypothetical protein JXR77_18795 [Lentisphaeria bacterium]|nr:hypothetical protein [Lentisphaeria bacterium]